MPDITVIIPIAPYHQEQAQRAIESARAQTIPVNIDPVPDPNRYGPGWARNVGIDRCQTPFVLFLDADDWLEPAACEVFQYHAQQYPGHYIYSDWWVLEDRVVEAPEPCDAWRGGTVNNLTGLIPVDWVRKVGGFDQSLIGGEDTDFFLKLITGGCCGIRVDAPLVHYSPEGQRGTEYRNSPEYARIHELLGERYKGKMGCCDDREITQMASNKKQDGDVLVVPEWGGNQPFHGRATRRNYDRQGNGNPFWCDPRDVPASRPPQVIRLLRPHEEEQRQVTVTQPVGQGGQTVDQPVVPHGVHEAAAVFPRWRVQEGRGAKYTPPNAFTERPRNIQDVIALGLEDEGDE